MKTAICLLTADRAHYTVKTLTSLALFNDLSEYILLHADDGSRPEAHGNIVMASRAGFHTCYAAPKRFGVVPALRQMWITADALGATHILHLENDIQSLRALPSRRDADSVRLYGEYKGIAPAYPTGRHIMETREPIDWRDDGDGWQRAACHWGAQPSITKTDLLVSAINAAESLKDVSRALLRINTVRPRYNFMAHIGEEKTKGAKFGP